MEIARLDTGAAGAAGAHARTAVALDPGGIAAATDGGAVARGAAGAVAPDLAGLALGPGAADEAAIGSLRSLACWTSRLADEPLRAASE